VHTVKGGQSYSTTTSFLFGKGRKGGRPRLNLSFLGRGWVFRGHGEERKRERDQGGANIPQFLLPGEKKEGEGKKGSCLLRKAHYLIRQREGNKEADVDPDFYCREGRRKGGDAGPVLSCPPEIRCFCETNDRRKKRAQKNKGREIIEMASTVVAGEEKGGKKKVTSRIAL